MNSKWLLACGALLTTNCSVKDELDPAGATNEKVVVSKNHLNMLYRTTVDSRGVRNGRQTVFYSNGRLAEIGSYTKGAMEGRFIKFSPEPAPASQLPDIEKIAYFKHNKLYGNSYAFYSRGRLQHIQRYIAGRLVGSAYYFDTTGKLICREYAGNDSKILAYDCYDSAGRKTESGGNFTVLSKQ